MSTLTIGDVRPFLSLVTALPIFDNSDTIAGSLRSLLESTGAPITSETDTALSIIEQNPILIAVGFAEFQAAINGLPDSTLLSDIPQFSGIGGASGGNTDSGDPGTAPSDPGTDPGVTTDANGNQVQSFTLPFSEIQFNVNGDTVTVVGAGINQQLVGLDRVTFEDGTYYLDGEETPGVVKTAYSALLGAPNPDGPGFEFWVNTIEQDALSNYFAMTEAFVQTDAFQQVYGDVLNDTGALLDRVYQNLLGRTADEAGKAFWESYLSENGIDTLDETLAYFLQSDEMQTLVGTTLSDGFFV